MRFVPYLHGFCCALPLLACSSSTSTTTAILRPELVAVSPDDFLGQTSCADLGGAAGAAGAAGAGGAGPANEVLSYVATLTDVTATPKFQLPSSAPTSCRWPVTFSFVVPNHLYTAHVEAYDLAADELAPLGSGSPLQTDLSGQRVVPLWEAECGGYPPSTASDAGIDSGSPDAGPPGDVSYSGLTQTLHSCGEGLTPIKAEKPSSN